MVKGILRRIRPLMAAVEERVGRGVIPADGMEIPVFAEAFMPDLAPSDYAPILLRLHRKRVVWVRQHRGAVVVYREKPERAPAPRPIGDSPLDRFIAAASPLVLRVVNSLAEDRHDPAARYVEDVECGRVVEAVRRHALRGCDLADMRTAMWRLFPERAMVAVSWHEPRLQREADDTRIEVVARPGRLPRGLDLPDRIVGLVGKAGPRGATTNDIIRVSRHVASPDKISATIAGLEEARRVRRIPMVKTRGRPTVRWGLVEA